MCLSGVGSIRRSKTYRKICRKSSTDHVHGLHADGNRNHCFILQKHSGSDRRNLFIRIWAERCIRRNPRISNCLGCKTRRLFNRSRTGIRRDRFRSRRSFASCKTGTCTGVIRIYRFFYCMYIHSSHPSSESFLQCCQ